MLTSLPHLGLGWREEDVENAVDVVAPEYSTWLRHGLISGKSDRTTLGAVING